MAFEIKRKAELTLVSLLAELIDPSGRQRSMPAPITSVFTRESLAGYCECSTGWQAQSSTRISTKG
jgi:hypothetical protein